MKAYLHAQIDTVSLRVRSVLISSDERPTIVKPHLIWAHITTTYGHDFGEARQEMLKQIMNMPYLQWAWQILPDAQKVH